MIWARKKSSNDYMHLHWVQESGGGESKFAQRIQKLKEDIESKENED